MALEPYLEAEVRLSAQALGVLKTLTTLVGRIHGRILGIKGGGGSGGGAGGLGGKFPGAGFAKALGAIGGALGSAVSAIASIPGMITGFVSTARKYVEALNPALVEQYDTQLRNLNATIGGALEPVISYATRSVKEFGGILLPAVQQIRPIVEQISRGVSGLASGAVRVLARALEWAAAVVQRLLPYIEQNQSSVAAMLEVLAAAIEAMSQFNGVVDQLVNLQKQQSEGIRSFTKWLAIATARLIGFFGGKEGLNNFKRSLAKGLDEKKNPRAGLTAAPKDASIGGIDEVLRRMNERAFVAGAGGETRAPDVRALEEIKGIIEGLQYKSLGDLIYENVARALKEAPRRAAQGAANAITGDSGSSGAAALSPALAVTSALLRK